MILRLVPRFHSPCSGVCEPADPQPAASARNQTAQALWCRRSVFGVRQHAERTEHARIHKPRAPEFRFQQLNDERGLLGMALIPTIRPIRACISASSRLTRRLVVRSRPNPRPTMATRLPGTELCAFTSTTRRTITMRQHRFGPDGFRVSATAAAVATRTQWRRPAADHFVRQDAAHRRRGVDFRHPGKFCPAQSQRNAKNVVVLAPSPGDRCLSGPATHGAGLRSGQWRVVAER